MTRASIFERLFEQKPITLSKFLLYYASFDEDMLAHKGGFFNFPREYEFSLSLITFSKEKKEEIYLTYN